MYELSAVLHGEGWGMESATVHLKRRLSYQNTVICRQTLIVIGCGSSTPPTLMLTLRTRIRLFFMSFRGYKHLLERSSVTLKKTTTDNFMVRTTTEEM